MPKLDTGTVRFHLLALVGAALLALLLTAILGATGLAGSTRRAQSLYEDRVVPLRDLKEIADMYAVNVVDVTHKVRNGNIGWDEARRAVGQAQQRISERLSAYLATYLVEDEQRLVEELRPLLAEADREVVALAGILQAEDADALTRFSIERMYGAIDPVSTKISQLIELQLVVAHDEYEQIGAYYSRVTTISAVTLLVLFVLGIIGARRIIRMVVGGAERIQRAVAHALAGDFSVRVEASGRDEIAHAGRDLDGLLALLQSLMSEAGDVAKAFAEGRFGQRVESAFSGEMGVFGESLNRSFEQAEVAGTAIASAVKAIATGQSYERWEGRTVEFAGTWGEMLAEAGAVLRASDQMLSELQHCMQAAAAGELDVRVGEEGKTGFVKALARNTNQLIVSVGDSLTEVRQVLDALAAGDLTQRVERDFGGVFGQMKDATNLTLERLTDIVARIQQSTDTISEAAAQISSGNADLSSRTEKQAASLEETAASVEELAAAVNNNAQNSRQARQLAESAAEVAGRTGSVVAEVVSTMGAIEASSKRIEAIIGVIDGISFQTNILALNAAVEAARAGDQGRGFAVVASEVRVLAQRSAEAAKEIKALIGESVMQVGSGAVLVEQAGQTMGEVVSAVRAVTGVVSEIAAATDEQATGIVQVNQTVTQIDETTQQNAALVEEAAAASRSLEEQAEGLLEAVAVFKVGGERSSQAGASHLQNHASKHAHRTSRSETHHHVRSRQGAHNKARTSLTME